jgi:cytochrome P450
MYEPKLEILSPEMMSDPIATLAYFRERDPVPLAVDFPAYLLTRYEDVSRLRDYEIFSTQLIRQMRESIDGLNMMQLDGEEHRRNRGLVQPAFKPKVLAAFVERELIPIIDEQIDAIASLGHTDLMETFCRKVPFWTIARLLGLEIQDEVRLAHLFLEQAAADPVQAAGDPSRLERSMAAQRELKQLVRVVVERVTAEPDDSFVSQLVQARSSDGDQLSEDEIYGLLMFLLPAGLGTTQAALSTAVYNLATRPWLLEELRADPSGWQQALEETLRWRAPIPYQNRVTLRDVEVRGVTIPAGTMVLAALNAANRDPAVFDRPDEFDIHRNPNRHVSFGVGIHACLGAPIARSSLREGIPRLFARLPNLRVQPGFEPRYVNLFDNHLEALPVEFDRS